MTSSSVSGSASSTRACIPRLRRLFTRYDHANRDNPDMIMGVTDDKTSMAEYGARDLWESVSR